MTLPLPLVHSGKVRDLYAVGDDQLGGVVVGDLDVDEGLGDDADRPGTALARMWNAVHPEIPARSADEFHSAAAVAAWVSRTLTEA